MKSKYVLENYTFKNISISGANELTHVPVAGGYITHSFIVSGSSWPVAPFTNMD